MIFVVGGKGLTGSAIVRYLKKNNYEFEIITRENKESYINKQCETLIYANGNAKKYLANEDPYFDFNASVNSVSFYLHNIKFQRFVHISTIDVYPDCSTKELTNENISIDISKQSIYGFHKYLAEQNVMKFAEKFLIFRLPALVGIGLTKNPIFDFINPEKKVFINENSALNVIDTDFIASSIFNLINQNISNEIFNLVSKNSIKISQIEELINLKTQYHDDAHKYIQNYQINSDKISSYIDLSTSQDAILKYYNSIKVDIE